jgi:hypothetical protein
MEKRNEISKRLLMAALILLLGICVCMPIFLSVSNAQTTSSPQPQQVPNLPYADDKVFVGIWILNVFDYQYTSNDYTLDMYLYFFWTNQNLTSIDWQFVNGYPITPTSVTLVTSNNASNIRYQIYRATARFSSAPDASNYPFDKINLTVSIVMAPHGNNVAFSWIDNSTGTDPNFLNAGWKTNNIVLTTADNSYPLGVVVPKAQMVVIQERQKTGASIAPFIPPFIFAAVCAIAFMFGLNEGRAIALRLSLISSMLVTILLFSFSLAGAIPPSETIALYNIFLISVLLFMVSSLIVTIVGAVDSAKRKDERRMKRFNRWGLLISIIIPSLFFFILYLARP